MSEPAVSVHTQNAWGQACTRGHMLAWTWMWVWTPNYGATSSSLPPKGSESHGKEKTPCMKAGSATGGTLGREMTENFQEEAETEPDWVAHTRLSSNPGSVSNEMNGPAQKVVNSHHWNLKGRRGNLRRGFTD